MARIDTASHWCHDIIYGVGGLLDYKKYELATYNGDCGVRNARHQKTKCEIAEWTLRCLANPDYKSVLDAVNKRAADKALARVKELSDE